uniref:Uncharacterized protein n=1 Tax=Aegilops tauschii TaxID=37682 RepID=M8C5Z6_AEGTA
MAVDGAELILSVPDDVLALISAPLRPRDLLALSAASRRLYAALSASDKSWLAQCRRLLPSSLSNLLAWRAAAGGSSLTVPMPGREYAGLWRGTFGWPPGRPDDERKPGKALFFLLLSYEEDSEGKLLLIATKVLEGTHYVVHPNGSSMFVVRVGESSTEAFPFPTDEDSRSVSIERCFAGEGIATGYGFRYPGSKPGSLFVLRDGRLAFVWRDNKSVLTLQRLNLEELLRKGERVPTLPPIPNFAYLTKSYSNVFVAIHGSPSCSSSPRYCTFSAVIVDYRFQTSNCWLI